MAPFPFGAEQFGNPFSNIEGDELGISAALKVRP